MSMHNFTDKKRPYLQQIKVFGSVFSIDSELKSAIAFYHMRSRPFHSPIDQRSTTGPPSFKRTTILFWFALLLAERDVRNPVNNEINYQPQLFSRISAINSIKKIQIC